MKQIILFFVLIFHVNYVTAQTCVQVINCDSMPHGYTVGRLDVSPFSFPLEVRSGIDTIKAEVSSKKKIKRYSINISNFEDTIQIVKELIDLRGDTRVICNAGSNRSTLSSALYWGTKKKKGLSVQVHALFVVWGLFWDYQYTAAYPVLVKRNGKKEVREAFEGKIVKEAFSAYEKWFKDANGDIDKLRNTKPLDGSGIRWLF